MSVTVPDHPYLALAAYCRPRGWKLLLSIDDAVRPSRMSKLTIVDRHGEEVDYVDFPAKKETSIDDAAAVLWEFVERTPTPED